MDDKNSEEMRRNNKLIAAQELVIRTILSLVVSGAFLSVRDTSGRPPESLPYQMSVLAGYVGIVRSKMGNSTVSDPLILAQAEVVLDETSETLLSKTTNAARD